MTHHDQTLAPPEPSLEEGFSLIEVIIASLVLLFISLGVIPIFTMAIQSNIQGQDSTRTANFARERLEQLMQVPFDHAELTIASGSTQNVVCETWDRDTDLWSVLACADWDNPVALAGFDYKRRVTVEQYQFGPFDTAMRTGANLSDVALDGDAAPSIVHIKQIIVEVESTRQGGIAGGGKSLTVRAFKSL